MRLELDERPGPARRISESRLQAMVTRALAIHEAQASGPRENEEPPSAQVGSGRPRRRGWGRAAVAAALALSAAGAVSAAVTHAWRLVPPRETSAAVSSPPRPAPLPTIRARSATPTIPVSPPEPPSAPTGAPPSLRTRVESVDWQRANELRAEHRWAAAAQAYAALSVHGAGPETSTAAVAAAALALEHLRRPALACRLYARALAKGAVANPVAEEARWGLAACARQQGHRDEEVRALRGFLAEHPGSVWRSEATTRLAALENVVPPSSKPRSQGR